MALVVIFTHMEVLLEDVVAGADLVPVCIVVVPATSVSTRQTNLLAPLVEVLCFRSKGSSVANGQTDHFLKIALKVRSVVEVHAIKMWLICPSVGLSTEVILSFLSPSVSA